MITTPEIVRELLHYDPDTGIFTWRERGDRWFKTQRDCRAWNTKFAGKRAGCLVTQKNTGYQNRGINLQGKMQREHRIAWLYMTDEPLPPEIDHINRDATDNRWVNLKASNRTDNLRNQSRHVANSSGVTGVTWDRGHGKWRAQCGISGKQHYLGLYCRLDEATEVVKAFRAKHGFSSGHGSEIAKYRQGVARC